MPLSATLNISFSGVNIALTRSRPMFVGWMQQPGAAPSHNLPLFTPGVRRPHPDRHGSGRGCLKHLFLCYSQLWCVCQIHLTLTHTYILLLSQEVCPPPPRVMWLNRCLLSVVKELIPRCYCFAAARNLPGGAFLQRWVTVWNCTVEM